MIIQLMDHWRIKNRKNNNFQNLKTTYKMENWKIENWKIENWKIENFIK